MSPEPRHEKTFFMPISHRIGDNRERRVLSNVMFSIAKINVFDCQNRYNGFIWQSLTIFLKMSERSRLPPIRCVYDQQRCRSAALACRLISTLVVHCLDFLILFTCYMGRTDSSVGRASDS